MSGLSGIVGVGVVGWDGVTCGFVVRFVGGIRPELAVLRTNCVLTGPEAAVVGARRSGVRTKAWLTA